MQDLVFQFLAGVLGTDGAQALRKASNREPALEPLLVPRAALAWIETKSQYEGPIPGIPNSYLRFQKSESGYTGTVSLDEGQYSFKDADVLHVASAVGVSTGIQLQGRKQVRDQALVKLGKSIDALVKAQDLFKATLRSPAQMFSPARPPQGYKLSMEQHAGKNFKVHAHDHSGNLVGSAWFIHSDKGIKPITVAVEEGHQRQGLATALYDHARHQTNRPILPPDLKTDEGEAFHANYKAELPGQAHKPTPHGAPEAPMAPQKQPAGAKPPKPKLPKMPALKVEKAEADRPCSACGGHFFKNERFQGCLCFRDLSKSVRTTVYGDGYVLEFSGGIDRPSIAALQKALRGL